MTAGSPCSAASASMSASVKRRSTRRSVSRTITWPSLPDGAEHAIEIGVREHPGRVGFLADTQEIVEVGVARAQRLYVEVVHLAPVRTPVDLVGDRGEPGEVLAVGHADELVDRDVGRVAAVRGGQPDVVGGGHANLD